MFMSPASRPQRKYQPDRHFGDLAPYPSNNYLGCYFRRDADPGIDIYTSADGEILNKINSNNLFDEVPFGGNNYNAVSGRDPSIIYHRGQFLIAVTDFSAGTYDFRLYRGPDLINWERNFITLGPTPVCSNSTPPPVGTNAATDLWSPYLFEDQDGTLYVLISIVATAGFTNAAGFFESGFQPYLSKCLDFDSLIFDVPVPLTFPGLTTRTIDSSVMYDPKYGYIWTTGDDEAWRPSPGTFKDIKVFTSQTLLGTKTLRTTCSFDTHVEGASLYKYYRDDGQTAWRILVDRFLNEPSDNFGHYYQPMFKESLDLSTWGPQQWVYGAENIRSGDIRNIADMKDAAKISSLMNSAATAWRAPRVEFPSEKHPNLILDPVHQVDQKNATIGTTTDASNITEKHIKDGALATAIGSGTLRCSRQLPTNTIIESHPRFRLAVQTADSSISSTDLYAYVTFIEGLDMVPFRFGTLHAEAFRYLARFYAPPGTYHIAFQNAAADRSFVHQFTIEAFRAGDLGGVLIDVTVPGCTTGTWLTGNGDRGLRITITLAAGSNFQTSTLDAWVSANALCTSAQSNGMSSTSNFFDVIASSLTQDVNRRLIEYLPASLEISRCQRYLQAIGGISGERFGFGVGQSTTFINGNMDYKREMSGAPLVLFTAAPGFQAFDGNSLLTATAVTANNVGPRSCSPGLTVASGAVQSNPYVLQTSGTGALITLYSGPFWPNA